MTTVNPPRPVPIAPPAWRAWIQAIRPNTLTAGAVPVVVGSALAVADDQFQAGPALAALLGAILLQIGCNLANDVFDFLKGADREDRCGPARATQRGWLTPAQVRNGAIVTFLAALATGVYLVSVAGWPVVAIGVAGIITAIWYTGGKRPLGYLGLGDPLVLVFFGVIAVCGTYYVQAGSVTAQAVWLSIGVGCLATAILVVNNLRDRTTDARARKNTLVVRFGARFGRIEYAGLLTVGYAIPLVIALTSSGPLGLLLVLISLPFAGWATLRVFETDGAALNPLLGTTAKLGVVYGLLLSVGVLV